MHNAANQPDAIQKSFVKSIGQDVFTPFFFFFILLFQNTPWQTPTFIHHNNCRTCIYIFFSSYRQNTNKTHSHALHIAITQYDFALQILNKWAFPSTFKKNAFQLRSKKSLLSNIVNAIPSTVITSITYKNKQKTPSLHRFIF